MLSPIRQENQAAVEYGTAQAFTRQTLPKIDFGQVGLRHMET